MVSKIDRNNVRKKRHKRVRGKVSGTPSCPRLNVYRSVENIYVQMIDDVNKVTLCASSTLDKTLKADLAGKTKNEQSKIVGSAIAKKALEKDITACVFDRGGYLYTGRVQNLANGAREAGLKF